MSERLYLIRIDMERFLGPMTLKEVREAYRAMQFDLHDEIACSNTEWVSFDDFEKLERYYPELSRLVKREMLDGWDVGDPGVGVIPLVSGNKRASFKPKLGFRSQLALLLGMATLVFVGLLLWKSMDLKVQIAALIDDPSILTALHKFKTGDPTQFYTFMDRNRQSIEKSIQNETNLKAWLPFIRARAFAGEGYWKGLSLQELRGYAPASPANCTYQSWLMRWRNGFEQAKNLISGEMLPSQNWLGIVLWDPIWLINTGKLNDGWLEPKSYYEGCLSIALKALKAVVPPVTYQETHSLLIVRLSWLLHLISKDSPHSDQSYEMTGFIWSISCLDAALDLNSIDKCLLSDSQNKSSLRYIQNRMILQKIRVLFSQANLGPEDKLRILELISTLALKDKVTGFDYSEEVKTIKMALKNGKKGKKPVARIQDLLENYRLILR